MNFHIKSRNYYIKLFGFKAQFATGKIWDEKRKVVQLSRQFFL